MLINFAQCNLLKIINTLYKKNLIVVRLGSHITTKLNEIDYILSYKPSLFTNSSVINQFNPGSDHRLLRAKLTKNFKMERLRMVRRSKRPHLQTLSAHRQEFKTQLQSNFKSLKLNYPIDTLEAKITDNKHSGSQSCRKNRKEKIHKLSPATKFLLNKQKPTSG